MNLKNIIAAVAVGCLSYSTAQALPLAEIKLRYIDNQDGTYTYFLKIDNLGPIAPAVTTPNNHTITLSDNGQSTMYPAGDKWLNDDENIVFFGIDTGDDEVSITDIADGDTAFHGTVEDGWQDSDNDGMMNKVIAWHLPFFGWDLSATLPVGESAKGLAFTLDRKIENFLYWFGGSDDEVIWVDDHAMGEDQFGIYDATTGVYLATLVERNTTAKKIKAKKACTYTNVAKKVCQPDN